jgi:hypothetical protein
MDKNFVESLRSATPGVISSQKPLRINSSKSLQWISQHTICQGLKYPPPGTTRFGRAHNPRSPLSKYRQRTKIGSKSSDLLPIGSMQSPPHFLSSELAKDASLLLYSAPSAPQSLDPEIHSRALQIPCLLENPSGSLNQDSWLMPPVLLTLEFVKWQNSSRGSLTLQHSRLM